MTASPTRSQASCASTSSQVPGKRRTPNFIWTADNRRSSASSGLALAPPRLRPCFLDLLGSRPSRSRGQDLVVLDQRVREQLLAHLRQPSRVVDVELDQAPDVHVRHALEAQRRQRPLDRLTLRVEDPGLRPHENAVARHGAVRSSHASNDSPVISSYASTYFAR